MKPTPRGIAMAHNRTRPPTCEIPTRLFHEQITSREKRRHELVIQMGGSDPNTHLAKSDLRTNVNEQRRSRLNLKFLLRQGLQLINHASLCLQTVSETDPRHLDSSYLRVSFPDTTTQRKVVYWPWVSSRSSSKFIRPIVNLTSSSQTQEHTDRTFAFKHLSIP